MSRTELYPRQRTKGGGVKLSNPERIALGGWATIFLGLVWLAIVLAASVFTAGDAQTSGLMLLRQLAAGVIAISIGVIVLGAAKKVGR